MIGADGLRSRVRAQLFGEREPHTMGWVAHRTTVPMDQVPAVVLKAAKEAAPDLTFYAAYNDHFNGQASIELKGKTKNGKIKEIELSPDGKVLGFE